jgi:hypothetical protein
LQVKETRRPEADTLSGEREGVRRYSGEREGVRRYACGDLGRTWPDALILRLSHTTARASRLLEESAQALLRHTRVLALALVIVVVVS